MLQDKVTITHLKTRLEHINRVTGLTHTLEGSGGKWRFVGPSNIVYQIHSGYRNKKDMSELMGAYIIGFEFSRQLWLDRLGNFLRSVQAI
jgi:hypothetical protein